MEGKRGGRGEARNVPELDGAENMSARWHVRFRRDETATPAPLAVLGRRRYRGLRRVRGTDSQVKIGEPPKTEPGRMAEYKRQEGTERPFIEAGKQLGVPNKHKGKPRARLAMRGVRTF